MQVKFETFEEYFNAEVKIKDSDYWRKTQSFISNQLRNYDGCEYEKLYDVVSDVLKLLAHACVMSPYSEIYVNHIINSMTYNFLTYENSFIFMISGCNVGVVDRLHGEYYIQNFDTFKRVIEGRGLIKIHEEDDVLPHVCASCGKIEKHDEFEKSCGGGYFCKECIESYNYVKCDDCGGYAPKFDVDRIVVVSGESETEKLMCWKCRDNYEVNGYCQYHRRYEVGSSHDMIITKSGCICNIGLKAYKDMGKELIVCECCGEESFNTRRKRDVNHKLITVCDDCYYELKDQTFRYGMSSYSFKPTPVFTSVDNRSYVSKGDEFFGVELEVDGIDYNWGTQEVAEEIESITNHNLCYCKSDGSLDEGLEIVTHPMSFDFIMDYNWDGLFKFVRSCGLESLDTCGLHVHMNKSSMGSTDLERDLTEAKIVCIFDKFYDNLVQVARREEYKARNWADANHAGFSESDSDKTIVSKKKECSTDRYKAVNLTNKNTVEIRLWASTLDEQEFVSTLYITRSILHMAKNNEMVTLLKMSWEDFKNKVMEDCPDSIKVSVNNLLNLA